VATHSPWLPESPRPHRAEFVNHPLHGRLYRTGDVCRYSFRRAKYCGRIDTQVKIHGYRIELEAIESYLSLCAGGDGRLQGAGTGAEQQLVAFRPLEGADPRR